MLKQLVISLLVLAAATIAQLDARSGYAYELGAALLYMRPARCDLQFGVLDSRPFVEGPGGPEAQENSFEYGPIGSIQSVNPEYELGYRALLGFFSECNCRDGRVIYTHFHTFNKKCIEPVPLSGSIWANGLIESNVTDPATTPYLQLLLFNGTTDNEVAAFAEANVRFNYDAVDIEFGMRRTMGCHLRARGYLGLHFADLDNPFEEVYQGTFAPGVDDGTYEARAIFGSVCRTSHAWGVGPRLGAEGEYLLGCGLSIEGCFSAALLAGARQAKYRQNFRSVLAGDSAGTLFENRPWNIDTAYETVVIPQLEARLGLSYIFCLDCCWNLYLAAGYEWISYVDFIARGPHFRMDKGISVMDCASFNLNGLYVTVAGTF